jgi:hypothetical protein
MLPNDVTRCVPSKPCPLKETCRRFTEPGSWVADFSNRPMMDSAECAVRIPTEEAPDV